MENSNYLQTKPKKKKQFVSIESLITNTSDVTYLIKINKQPKEILKKPVLNYCNDQ